MKYDTQDIKNIIIKNMNNYNFSVAMLAEILDISPSHLRDIINQHFFMSPSRLIESLRLEKAVCLLQEGASLDSVRRKTGYIYARTLRRVFKKRLHKTPQECQEILLKTKAKLSALKTFQKEIWNV
jgi:AraC-like DNA-binding protein